MTTNEGSGNGTTGTEAGQEPRASVSIKEAKRTRGKKTDPLIEDTRTEAQKKAEHKALLNAHLFDLLNVVGYGWNDYPLEKMIRVYRADNGVEMLIASDRHGVCKIVEQKFVIMQLMDYCSRDIVFETFGKTRPTVKWISSIVEDWVHTKRGENLDEIKMVREKTEPGLCWNRMKYDLAPGETPVFDEMMGRFDNVPALMAFIGSLFDPESDRQQYVWMYGEGRNGKGSLLTFLQGCFGDSYLNDDETVAFQKSFWSSGLIGKRIVAYEDCTDPKLVQRAGFKMMTGGAETVRMEFKGKQSFQGKVNAKFISCSNDKPDIPNTDSHRRRAILVLTQPLPEGTKTLPKKKYQAMLEAEGAAFLWKCRQEYEKSRETGVIPVDETGLIETMDKADERWVSLFDRFFEVSDGEISATPVYAAMTDRERCNLSNQEVKKFKQWMERVKGIKFTVRKEKGVKLYRYFGVKIRYEIGDRAHDDCGPM